MIDWDKVVDQLDSEGESTIPLWGWSTLNSSICIRNALKKRKVGYVDLKIVDEDTIKITKPGKVKSMRREKSGKPRQISLGKGNVSVRKRGSASKRTGGQMDFTNI